MPMRAADQAGAVRRRAAAVVRASGMRRPPFSPERYAVRCGVAAIVAALPPGAGGGNPEDGAARDGRGGRVVIRVDRRLPPHTPQWNGAVALGLAGTLVPDDVTGEERRALVEAAAAELLLPMAVFRPRARRTDLTADGLRDLAAHFAAPLRLAARQWLSSGLWHGYALLWREDEGALRLRWRAASAGRFPPALRIGADAAGVWAPDSRLFATCRTRRPHHGVEEVRTGAGTAWWFTRFAPVREDAGAAPAAVFAMVLLDARGEGMPAGPSK